MRGGVAVDGGSVAVQRRGAGRWGAVGGRRTAQVGLPRLGYPSGWEMGRGVPFASAGGWVSTGTRLEVGGRRGKGGLPSVPEGGAGSFLGAG